MLNILRREKVFRKNRTKSVARRHLRLELLEPRWTLSAHSLTHALAAARPSVAAAASALPKLVTGTAADLSVLGAYVAGESTLMYVWSVSTLPGGAAAPSFTVNDSNAAKHTTVTFAAAGTYGLSVLILAPDEQSTTSTLKLTVSQALTQIMVNPGIVSVSDGATEQFAALGFDQFGKPLAAAPKFKWTASEGTISAGGLFTAPPGNGVVTVMATAGSLHSTANVTVANFLGLTDSALAALTQNLFTRDGSVTRADMIQILVKVDQAGRVVSGADFNDLKTILNDAAVLNMPGYVQVLAGDIVNGNTANADYQGQPLGELAAGSPSTTLYKLTAKWFYGADHPVASGYTYRAIAGSLFGSGLSFGPSYTDLFQGGLGDCYFLSTLGSIAERAPDAIENMFIANGDNTWTVRFYVGGTADYVTVDNMLPVDSSGRLVYANYSPGPGYGGNKLWVPLAEKAYAQWNETGNEGRDGQNNYAGIAGGWMDVVYAQTLGYAATDYYYQPADEQTLISALAANQSVTTGTNSNGGDGLYGEHAYVVLSYNSGAQTFMLYNPWGSNQPGPLTWNQLVADCDVFTIADPTGTVPISAPRVGTGGQAAHVAQGGPSHAAGLASWLDGGNLAAAHKLSLAAIDQLFAAT
ncbi:MAG: C2 family cysteine protease [Thermoguttaceae bacterium]